MIWDDAGRKLIERTIKAHEVRDPSYNFVWLPGVHRSARGTPMNRSHTHVCHGSPGDREKKVKTHMSCDNFAWNNKIPTENLIFHGQCDRCMTVFLAEREDDDTLPFNLWVYTLIRKRGAKE